MATRLRRLKIQRFRDLRPGTELFFNDGWNVLLGRNGSGKTTLLHLISMVMRDDFSAMQSENFSLEYELEVDGARLSVSLDNQQTNQGPLARAFESKASFRVQENNGQQWGFEFADGVPVGDIKNKERIPRDYGNFKPRMMAFYTNAISMPDQENGRYLTQTEAWIISQRSSNCFRVDEGLATFESVTGTGIARRLSVAPSSQVSLIRGANSTSLPPGWSYFVPLHLAEIVRQSLKDSSVVAEIELGNDWLLDVIIQLIGASKIKATARPVDSGGSLHESIRVLGRFEFYAQFAGTDWIHHDHWSFGQQRLLTLFWYLACNPEVLVVDEPVNGLHWEWIEAFVEAIGDRQVFATAQNPLLLEHVGFDSPEKVQRSFVLCRREARGENAREMVWTQPSAEQAESFFRAWSTGVQPVHEVLKTEGLW